VTSSEISVAACKDAQDQPRIVMSVDALSGDVSSRRVIERLGQVPESTFVTNCVTGVRGPISWTGAVSSTVLVQVLVAL
jgi:hypothetical protein